MPGRVVHFEIPFDDGDRARAFYGRAFGWDLQSMPQLNYTMVGTGPVGEGGMPTEPGYIGGGMFQREDGPINAPIVTIDVDDIDAALEQIEVLGGNVVQPKAAVGSMGFTAYFRDTEGNVLGLWQTARGEAQREGSGGQAAD